MIQTATGAALKVDPEDLEAVGRHHWHAHSLPNVGLVYWGALVDGVETFLGTFVLGLHGQAVGKDQSVLYRNGDLADATKANLVIVKLGTAMHRRYMPKRGGMSETPYIGVSEIIRDGVATGFFKAKIREDRKTIYLGISSDAEGAARKYDKAARQLHGDLARTNFSLEE